MQHQTIPLGLCECGCGEATKLAPRTHSELGWVKGVPVRFVNGHQGRLGHAIRYADKTTRYIEGDRGYGSPCWLWQLTCDHFGYGRLRHQGKLWNAHRFYWVQANGPIPDGLQLDHLCRVPSCVNPAHLEPVTPAENMARARPFRPRAPGALSDEDVRAIRTAPGLHREIAAAYGVTRSWVTHIKLGRGRKSVA